MKITKSNLYEEEFSYIFSKKAECVRGALVSSAFIEGQIILLTQSFLEAHGVIHKPRRYQESLKVLWDNEILNSKELRGIKKFSQARNRAIHAPFKEMTRREWEELNKGVVKLARPIIGYLDKKLYSET